MQSSKATTSSGSAKPKKNSKDREKRKSQSQSVPQANENNSNDKPSPSKDAKEYAGINSDSIRIYAEQSCYEFLSDEVCNVLAEDINYKLRYIIHNSLLSARLVGRDGINSEDIEETFSNLNIDKVYGASSNPNWVPFEDQNLHYLALDETKINLIEMAEDDDAYVQEGDIILKTTWCHDSSGNEAETQEALRAYFVAMCTEIACGDAASQKFVLQNISENAYIGPITEWFYHFVYFLLMKNVTYDKLTLRALYLLDVLENSPLHYANVSVKQLKLLVRLLLQRLLISVTTRDILKPMCSVLATLCLREPLKEMVILKMNQKMFLVCQQMALPLLTSIYFLGIDAVTRVFLPHMNYFLTRIMQEGEMDLVDVVLAIYGLICKARVYEAFIHNAFRETFGSLLVLFWVPFTIHPVNDEQMEIDFINMKKQLIKGRRKVDCCLRKSKNKPIEDVFDIPTHSCAIRQKLNEHVDAYIGRKRETHVTVGKTSLLLSILDTKKTEGISKCCGHSLMGYNF